MLEKRAEYTISEELRFQFNGSALLRWCPVSRLPSFDYIYASVLRREKRYYGEAETYAMVSRAGEGWTFGLEEGEVEGFLAERGFEIVAHYTPGDLEEAYLTAEDGARFGRINGTHNIVVASVCEGARRFSDGL